MTADEIKEKVMEIIDASQKLKVKIDEINEWDSFTEILNNISKIVAFVTSVVVIIENVVKEFMDENITGDMKLEAAARLLDDLVTGNVWIEIIDKYVFKIIVSTVVHYLNEKYGHTTWLMDA